MLMGLLVSQLVLNPYRITCSRGYKYLRIQVQTVLSFKPLSHYMQSRIKTMIKKAFNAFVLNPYRITCSRGYSTTGSMVAGDAF